MSHDFHVLQRAVVVQRYAGVIEQVLVANGVHTTMRQDGANMLAQLLGDAERVVQLLHEHVLLGGESGDASGEVAVVHGVLLAVDAAYLPLKVDGLDEAAVLHLPLRAAVEDASLLLELDDANGLVHLCRQQQRLLVNLIVFQQFGHELGARVVAVGLQGKSGQGDEVDAIAVLEGGQVSVAKRQAQHVADAGIVACAGSHPEHVVVSPLDVPRLVSPHDVHDDVGSRATVVDVAKYVQLVDGQPLDDVAQGADEIVGTSCRYDGVDNDGHVSGLVLVVGTFVQQFLDDVGELAGQRFAHLRAGVLRRYVATHFHQLVYGDVIPVVDVLVDGLDQFQFLLRVVDERTQLLLLGLADGVAENLVDLALDVARGVLQHVLESLVFAMQVGQEVLGALGQVHDGLQVDDFFGSIGNRRERLREQIQVVHVGGIHIFR